jgi:hypothetical protein
MIRACEGYMREGKNKQKEALSREKVLISGFGNGRLRPVFRCSPS